MTVMTARNSARWICTSLVLALVALLAQSPAAKSRTPAAHDELPSAAQIVGDYLDVLGGVAALEQVRTRNVRGTRQFGSEGSTHAFSLQQMHPNRWLVRLEQPEGAWLMGSDGVQAWEQPPRGRPELLDGVAQADARREWDIQRDLVLRREFPEMIVHGIVSFDGLDCYLVEARPVAGQGRTAWLYFGAPTKFLLQREYREDGPEGQRVWQIRYSEYRDVKGVKYPFQIQRIGPDGEWTLRATDVQHNVKLPNDMFRLPDSLARQK